jgi:hypothetical protein
MTLSLKIGLALVAALVVAALLAFGAVDSLLLHGAREMVSSLAPTVLLISYLLLWGWMVADHIFLGDGSHTVLVSLFLIVGGGIAALIYFFAVFYPRESRSGQRIFSGGG